MSNTLLISLLVLGILGAVLAVVLYIVAQRFKVDPLRETCGGIGVLRLRIEIHNGKAYKEIGRGTILHLRHAESNEIELGTHRALDDRRAETKIAPCLHIGVAALYEAECPTDIYGPTVVEIVAHKEVAGGIDLAEHALPVEVANIVHTTASETHLAVGTRVLGIQR